MKSRLTLIVPCFNEEPVIASTAAQLCVVLDNLTRDNLISADSNIIIVDDGSRDKTWKIIQDLSNRDTRINGVKLSRNSGHQNALLAGLEEALQNGCDISITIDADLQDDIAVIPQMIKRYHEGNEIIYGVRSGRQVDSAFKRKSADFFYHLMDKTDSPMIPNHSDFRLMSRNAMEMLMQFKERNLFLRGIVPLIGLNTAIVYYDRLPRTAGKSKYPLGKMISFAIEGITSFSVRPIRMIFSIGLIFLILTLTVLIYVIAAILLGRNIPGWASIMLSIWFIGSLILMALGIIGEYVSKIYLESKHRPRYFVEKRTNEKSGDKKI